MSLMLTEPKAFTSGNYALESGGRFYRQRTGKVRAIVMHVTAGLQDLGMEGTDESAEGTNRWALNSGAQVSWHRIADSDGVERCLPSWATAWHAEGYNSNTVGEEISNVDARWDNKPDDWVTWTLWWAAVGVADWVVEYKVPLRRATQAELDRAIATDGPPVGFIDHSRLSTNRRDPGATFPWDRFFTYVAAVIDGATSPEEDDMADPATIKAIADAVWAKVLDDPRPDRKGTTAARWLTYANIKAGVDNATIDLDALADKVVSRVPTADKEAVKAAFREWLAEAAKNSEAKP